MPVYFIGQEDHGPFAIKIGKAKNIQKRRKQLQTGNPVELKILGWLLSDNDLVLEKQLHQSFRHARGQGEWFAIEPADILPVLMRAGQDGFIAKNADAFEIIGHDRDGIPEYLGVWEWGDLELEECCPFCGCLCGMHFQDASQMYYCINCDELTNFSEDEPDCDDSADVFRCSGSSPR